MGAAREAAESLTAQLWAAKKRQAAASDPEVIGDISKGIAVLEVSGHKASQEVLRLEDKVKEMVRKAWSRGKSLETDLEELDQI